MELLDESLGDAKKSAPARDTGSAQACRRVGSCSPTGSGTGIFEPLENGLALRRRNGDEVVGKRSEQGHGSSGFAFAR
jgi:hypothetical protein